MGKRNMYPTTSTKEVSKLTRNYMNFLQYADGNNSLEKIAVLIKLDLTNVKKIYKILFKKLLVD